MFKPFSIASPLFTFLLIQYTFFPTVESTECIDVSQPKTRVFKNLLDLQLNKIPFDPSQAKFDGNYVTFNEKDIDTLYKNSFITFDSGHIQKLFLDDHQIRVIQDGAFFSLTCLMSLNLRKNRIDSITKGMFAELKSLHELDLGENNLKEIPERVFYWNQRLRKLNITGNNLRVLHPESFFKLSLLEELDLSDNALLGIHPDTFQFLDNLVNLQLGSNQLERLDVEKWTHLSKLSILNLSKNALESFDTTNNFSFGSNLSALYLNENLLTKLNPVSLRRNLPVLKSIDIDDNLWTCSDLLPILSIFNDSRISYIGSALSDPNVAGIACNRSAEPYKRKKWIDVPVQTSSQPSNIQPAPLHYVDDGATGSPLYLSNVKILDSVKSLQTIIVCLFIIIVIFIVIDVAVRSGCLTAVMGRRRHTALDNSDVENFSLLRERF